MIAFDQIRAIGSDGNIPADRAVLRVLQAGLPDQLEGFPPERNLEAFDGNPGDRVNGFRFPGDVRVDAGACDAAGLFVDRGGEVSGGEVVDWGIYRDTKTATENVIVALLIQ